MSIYCAIRIFVFQTTPFPDHALIALHETELITKIASTKFTQQLSPHRVSTCRHFINLRHLNLATFNNVDYQLSTVLITKLTPANSILHSLLNILNQNYLN